MSVSVSVTVSVFNHPHLFYNESMRIKFILEQFYKVFFILFVLFIDVLIYLFVCLFIY